MKKNLLFLFLLLSLPEIAFSQKQNKVIDSLTQVLKTAKEDTNKVNTINLLCNTLLKTDDLSRAMSYVNEALSLAEKIIFKKGVANAYRTIASIYSQQGNYLDAIKNYLISLKIKEELGDKKGMAAAYGNIGNIYKQQGNYPEALKNYFSASKIYEQIGYKQGMADCYNNIGNLYFQEINYSEALKNFTAALKIGEEIGYKHIVAYSYTNIGNVYALQNNNSEALKSYFASLKIRKEIGEIQGSANTYDNIGNIYSAIGKYSDALKNYSVALKIREQTNDKQGMGVTYLNLGELHTKLHKLPEAKEYLSKALLLSKETKGKDQIVECYSSLAELDSISGNFKEAYQYHRLYSKTKDSILNEESNKQVSQLKIQYESEKKDREIESMNKDRLLNETEIKRQKTIKNVIAAGTGALILIAVLSFFVYRSNRQRKESELSNQIADVEMKSLRAQLNPHFIFNALNSIKSFIDTNPQTSSDYLTRFSLLMRGVLEGSEEKEISLNEEMQLMQHYIELEKIRIPYGLNYSITYEESVNNEEIMIPPLITQPVIENAVWHGLASLDKKGELKIHHSLSGNTLIITVSNTFANDAVQNSKPGERKSFGMKITRERLALLKQTIGKAGTLNLEMLRDETKVTITIPLKEIAV